MNEDINTRPNQWVNDLELSIMREPEGSVKDFSSFLFTFVRLHIIERYITYNPTDNKAVDHTCVLMLNFTAKYNYNEWVITSGNPAFTYQQNKQAAIRAAILNLCQFVKE